MRVSPSSPGLGKYTGRWSQAASVIEVHAPLCRHSFQPSTVNHIPPLVALGLYWQNKRAYTEYIYNRFSPLVISACLQYQYHHRRCAASLFTPFRYGSILDPYSKTVPAVIAKASAIYNPFIYAITHSKYRWVRPSNYSVTYVWISGGSFADRTLFFFNRDTLAEKVPCLHFLSQAPRRDCISASHSDSFCRDPVLSRQSSVSKTKFQRVSSMSTTDTVSLACDPCFEDV